MKRLILGCLLAFLVVLGSDYIIASVQSSTLQARLGHEDVLWALNNLVASGMNRSEVERRLEGFREGRVSPADNENYWVSYRYWFGFIPPIGVPEIKLLGAIEVLYSKDGRVKESHYWVN